MQTLAIQLKSSRCAEDEEVSAHAVLRNRVKPAKHSKRKVFASIVEDMRTVLRQSSRHTQSSWNIVLDLNYHENAALVDAHAKKCKFLTEAESAHEETVA